MMITSLDYFSYIGRIAVGGFRGNHSNQSAGQSCEKRWTIQKSRVKKELMYSKV